MLPILWGDTLVGRLDLKADRQRSTLLVHGAYAEPGVPVDQVAPDVVQELRAMGRWLGLEQLSIGDRGDLASPLQRVAGQYARG